MLLPSRLSDLFGKIVAESGCCLDPACDTCGDELNRIHETIEAEYDAGLKYQSEHPQRKK